MSSTTFVDKITVINTDWLNDVNGVVWTLFAGTTNPAGGRAALNLGTMATQNANAVAITGGTITGLGTPLPVASGGTGATNASGARLQLVAAQSGANSDITSMSVMNSLAGNLTVGSSPAVAGVRSLQVVNTDAGATSSVSSYVQTNAGLLQLVMGSTAGGGTASILCSASGAFNIYTTQAQNLQLGTFNRSDDIRIDSTGTIYTAGQTAATNYGNRGDVVLPANRGIRANNTAKAWVRFDGTPVGSYPITLTAVDSFGVQSITKNAVGDYTINFAAGIFADANYCAVGTAGSTTAAGFYTFRGPVQSTPTATAYRCRVSDSAPNYIDVNHISIAFFGD